jgi:hypothetical protein
LCLVTQTAAAADPLGAIRNAGGLDSVDDILATMRAHAGHAGVQEAACEAIINMLIFQLIGEDSAGASGAVEVVVAAMRAHAGHTGVQKAACGALMHMGGSAGNMALLAAAGAGAAVLAAMRAHAGHAGVQEAACGALKPMLEGKAPKQAL